MIQFFISGGIFMWLLLMLLVVNMSLVVKKAVDLNEGRTVGALGIHAILFIGISSVALGMFGQILGLMQGMKAIIMATDVNPEIVKQGFLISYYPTIFGFVILALSAIAWILLYRIARKRSFA